MNGVIEACVGVAATAAYFGLALAMLRARRGVGQGVGNRFLIMVPGPETDMYKPQHTEYVVGSDEDGPPETGLRIVVPEARPNGGA